MCGKHRSKARVRHCPGHIAGEWLSLDASPSSCLQRYCVMQPKRLHFLELIKPFKSCVWVNHPKVISNCIRLYSIKGTCARRKNYFLWVPMILSLHPVKKTDSLSGMFESTFPPSISSMWCLSGPVLFLYDNAWIILLQKYVSHNSYQGFLFSEVQSLNHLWGPKKYWGLPKDHPQCLWI